VLRQQDRNIEKVILAILDLGAFFIAANLAFDLRYHIDWPAIVGDLVKPGPAPWGALYQALPYMLLGWFVIFATFGLYSTSLNRRQEISLIIKAQAVAYCAIFATAFFYRGFSYSRGAALFLMPLGFLWTLGFRMLFRTAKEFLFRMPVVKERVLIVGGCEKTKELVERLQRTDNPYELVGVLAKDLQTDCGNVPLLGNPQELGKLLTRKEVNRVLLVSSGLSRQELLEAMDACFRHRISWAVVPDLYDLLVDRLCIEQIAGIPVMGAVGSNIVGLNLAIKRLVDLFTASFLLIVLSPVMLLVAALIRMTSKGPVLYSQKRVGRDGKIFKFYKFRSMYLDNRDKSHRKFMEQVIQNGQGEKSNKRQVIYKMKDDPRITPIGRWIRRFSIDELPQLINVIIGDMSLVGPRPAVPYEVEKYAERHKKRLQALPGITGLWQVSGRNRLSFEEMVDLDIHYIENWSVSMDIRIFFKTIAAVLFSRGY
jgi:exopolysaccharide biosynthesis polyprenyl glycosylphosphotransferase